MINYIINVIVLINLKRLYQIKYSQNNSLCLLQFLVCCGVYAHTSVILFYFKLQSIRNKHVFDGTGPTYVIILRTHEHTYYSYFLFGVLFKVINNMFFQYISFLFRTVLAVYFTQSSFYSRNHFAYYI